MLSNLELHTGMAKCLWKACRITEGNRRLTQAKGRRGSHTGRHQQDSRARCTGARPQSPRLQAGPPFISAEETLIMPGAEHSRETRSLCFASTYFLCYSSSLLRNTCPNRFSSSCRHPFIHSGQKPYGCGLCMYNSVMLSNLERHMVTDTQPDPSSGGKRPQHSTKKARRENAGSLRSRTAGHEHEEATTKQLTNRQ